MPRAPNLAELEDHIGYTFGDRSLLEQALTHRSYANEDETGATRDNELLEFLGDAVIGLVVAEMACRGRAIGSPGSASELRATLVSRTALTSLAERWTLPQFLRLGRGEERSGGRQKASLAANAFEAVTGAIFLDGGYDAARAVLTRIYGESYAALVEQRPPTAGAAWVGLPVRDSKSTLQEWLQARGHRHPEYTVLETIGPDHDKRFRVAVRIDGAPVAEATGSSRKEAEQAVARAALGRLRASGDDRSNG